MRSKTTLNVNPATSFLTGIARLVDFGGSLNSRSKLERLHRDRISDRAAIESDWLAIGKDITTAISKYDQTLKSKRKVSNVR